ncbi:hypothetical protein M918_14270 [Clostridium sp. BL8]|nr:hypothetical protein M918_14270 [Clostridium sp. BL8]
MTTIGILNSSGNLGNMDCSAEGPPVEQPIIIKFT